MSKAATPIVTSLFFILSMGLTSLASADGHETVEGLKAALAGAEKKMAAVTKDRDALYDQLLATIEELEAAESGGSEAAALQSKLDKAMADNESAAAALQSKLDKAMADNESAAAASQAKIDQAMADGESKSAALQTKLDQVTAGRDFLAGRLEERMAESKEMQADAAAELESSENSNAYMTGRLEELFNASKSSASAHSAEVAALEAENANLADIAFEQINSAIAERNAVQEQLDASNKSNMKMQSDLESVINGRTYIENLLKKAKDESAAKSEDMQAEIDSANQGRDYIADRLELVSNEAKAKSSEQGEMIAKLEAQVSELENSPARWAENLSSFLTDSYSDLSGVQVSKLSNNTVNIRVGNSGLFKVADTQLSDTGKSLLGEIGSALSSRADSQVLVVGHTDNIPVGNNSRFADNEDLSNQRALEAMNQLGTSGVSFDRMSSTGVADRSPIADNGTAEGRAQNRRVEIVLTPMN